MDTVLWRQRGGSMDTVLWRLYEGSILPDSLRVAVQIQDQLIHLDQAESGQYQASLKIDKYFINPNGKLRHYSCPDKKEKP